MFDVFYSREGQAPPHELRKLSLHYWLDLRPPCWAWVAGGGGRGERGPPGKKGRKAAQDMPQ